MLFYLLAALVTIPSPLISFAEPWIILIGLAGERSWMLAGVAVGLGQTIGFGLIYLFGGALVARIPRLQRKIDTFDVDRFRERAPWFLAAGSVFGLPPHFAMCACAPLVGVPFWRLMALTWAGRSLRFSLLGAFPATFVSWFGEPTWMPTWLRALT